MQRFLKATLLLFLALVPTVQAFADPPQSKSAAKRLISRVCDLIESEAGKNGLPKDFFARLIWKESRFDPNAVSPVGAEGIAQFMPGTAKMRGLANSFDIEQAIPASAKYLAEMKASYGNLGLAAAAYNAGENRVSRWLASGGFLPMETESYVFDIMGEPVDKFSDRSYAGTVQPLDPKMSFGEACRRLPVIMSRTVAMASINVKPWGVQVAGNFRRSAAIGQWLRVKSRFPALLASHDPVVSRVRTPIGRRGIYAVRIGADSRSEADDICNKLQSVGGACVVLRNR
ncbi:lytic transglycosylase domain-containing protein [Mesorhizobium sp. B4-1-3]|uniref:lytic transglycosylase domain-containing protein n=1 Tax=Mesorhizobium sp. B4-1-3 TaxID=2589889 RepID=UPI00112B72FB|nr:lytic transglycosylase domain-containing protein [Mesorhizobium sp. B4-1-3]TPI13408.1 lytic transglycosylase domain-containing protein [Mesorhizobium sp. B4-1-3]